MIENIKEIIDFYLKGNSLNKTGLKFNKDPNTIKRILEKNFIPVRSWLEVMKSNTFFCNDNYFEKIDSKDKAYYLGFLTADGWINKKGFGIALNTKDKYILELFKEKLNYQGKIGSYRLKTSQKEMNYLVLTSEKIKTDLAKYGVIKNKTHYTYFPDIPEELHSHFIRGIFDGDGCISYYKTNLEFSIVGNFILISKLQEILIKNCNLNKTVLRKDKNKNNNIFYIKYAGNLQCKRIYDYLYKDCEDLYLTRKKEKFEQI